LIYPFSLPPPLPPSFRHFFLVSGKVMAASVVAAAASAPSLSSRVPLNELVDRLIKLIVELKARTTSSSVDHHKAAAKAAVSRPSSSSSQTSEAKGGDVEVLMNGIISIASEINSRIKVALHRCQCLHHRLKQEFPLRNHQYQRGSEVIAFEMMTTEPLDYGADGNVDETAVDINRIRGNSNNNNDRWVSLTNAIWNLAPTGETDDIDKRRHTPQMSRLISITLEVITNTLGYAHAMHAKLDKNILGLSPRDMMELPVSDERRYAALFDRSYQHAMSPMAMKWYATNFIYDTRLLRQWHLPVLCDQVWIYIQSI
jgi:hypothetical protein